MSTIEDRGGIVHWDDVEAQRAEMGHLAATWRNLGRAAGTVTVGLNRIEIDSCKWSTPVHVHGAEEEIVFVLGGSGLSWQEDTTYEIREGDCIVHAPGKAGGKPHSLRAGMDGLDVLIYGTRVPVEAAYLPRAGVSWLTPTWADTGGDHPWEREVKAGEPQAGEAQPRPSNIVNVDDFELEEWVPGGDIGISTTWIARHAGATLSGLNLDVVHPGKRNGIKHIHSAEEELFVALEGDGTFYLGDEEHAVRAGHVISVPPGGQKGHCFRAGENGMKVLLYGTRDPNDICYYPESKKMFFRGLGVITRVEELDYLDGEI